MKGLRYAASALLLAGLLAPQFAFAGRSVKAPRFQIHDWTIVDKWCENTSTKAYFKNLEISISNLSDVPQNITLHCNGSGMGSGSATNPSENLKVTSMISGSGETSPNTNLTYSFTLPANGSTVALCHIIFRGPQATEGFGGDWHLFGAFDVSIDVAEDRGAVSAVINSTFEDSGCLKIANDPVGLHVSTIRNIPRTMLINGGRPF